MRYAFVNWRSWIYWWLWKVSRIAKLNHHWRLDFGEIFLFFYHALTVLP
jgi:hypothetical protein